MLATTMKIPLSSDWAYEVKWDGMRLLADIHVTNNESAPRVSLTTRSEADVSGSFPEITEALTSLDLNDVLFDGELVALDANGVPSFPALASRMHLQNARRVQDLAATAPLTLVLFDVLRLDGTTVIDASYSERRTLLESIELPAPRLILSTAFDDGEALINATAEQGLEGVIAKRRASKYQPGVRSPDWIKHAHRALTTVAIVGWRRGNGRAAGRVGSLVTAVPDGSGSWLYRGTAGSGISDADGAALGGVLPSVELPAPIVQVPPADLNTLKREGYHWCEPVVVADVRHLGRTGSGKLRQPVVERLRPDLDATDVPSESGSAW